MPTTKPKKTAVKTERSTRKSNHSDLVQAGKFSLVGIVNTLIDFIILNIFNIGLGVPRIPANVISATFAMTFSFWANRQLVFKPSGKHYLRQALLFLVVTAFGLYLLQNVIIYGLTELWTWPLDTAYKVVEALGLDNTFSLEFVYTNGSKVVATLASMVWNFFLYKRVVFKK